MSDDMEIRTEFLFGSIELRNVAPRIVGNDLYPRYRVIERDGKGTVTRDEVLDAGCCLINGAPYAYLF